ncbi:NUDIX hydrolase [Candidatus Gracilibacteria bacterium]|nr:NUDIX hydrolase [Candidatus Gracilibacteria bacterium]
MNSLLKPEEMMDLWNTKLSIPIPSMDIVIFTLYKGHLCVVLDKFEGNAHVLPGNILAGGYSLEDNFDAILERKTGIKGIYKEQLYTFGSPARDKRGHVLSISYYALVGGQDFINGIDFTKVDLIRYDELSKANVLYDHKEIIDYARNRLKSKIIYTTTAKEILKKEFRISELREVYEIVLDKEIDRRNFQKKVLSLNIIQETGNIDKSTNRPAKLYSFIDDKIRTFDDIF